MDDFQAKTIIDLLTEISTKLSDISAKISSDYDSNTISEQIDKVVSSVDDVVRNTSSLS